jgi:hypothetical protein
MPDTTHKISWPPIIHGVANANLHESLLPNVVSFKQQQQQQQVQQDQQHFIVLRGRFRACHTDGRIRCYCDGVRDFHCAHELQVLAAVRRCNISCYYRDAVRNNSYSAFRVDFK